MEWIKINESLSRAFAGYGTISSQLSQDFQSFFYFKILHFLTFELKLDIFLRSYSFLKRTGSSGSGSGEYQFKNPEIIDANSDFIAVADFSNIRVQMFDYDLKF